MMRLPLALALALALLALAAPAQAFHQAGDCAYQGPAPALPGLGGTGTATLCLAHVNEAAPAGTERTEVNVVYAEWYEQWLVAGRRVALATLSDANQYAFTNAAGSGNGTRANSDTGLWAYEGNRVAGGAGLGAGARQFDAYDFGGTSFRVELQGFLPRAEWFGLGLYYTQSFGNGRCTESLVLSGYVGGQSVYEPLVPAAPCVVQAPQAPNVVQP